MSKLNKMLKPFKLYGQDIDFIVNEGGKIETKEDLKDFLNDNLELLQLIYSYEDDLIRVGGGVEGQDINHMIRKIFKNIKKEDKNQRFSSYSEGCGFDEKKYKSKNFYEMPIIEFKKLFD